VAAVRTTGKRVAVSRGDAGSHLGKARQFLAAATTSIDASHHDAALLGAIHAGISAADAVAITLAGIRSTDPDHLKAADLLVEVGRDAKNVEAHARQLRQLLMKKNVVEYESRRATAAEALDAVRRATRLCEWASDVVAAARL
jgi:hypothetical protein